MVFERTATREAWPKVEWAGFLAPFLNSDAQKAYFDLAPVHTNNYDHFKAKILAHSGVTPAWRAQKYHSWNFKTTTSPRSPFFDLIHLAKRWLNLEANSSARVEIMVMDCFLWSKPSSYHR